MCFVVISCCRKNNNAILLYWTLALFIIFKVFVIVVLVSQLLYKVGCEYLFHQNLHAEKKIFMWEWCNAISIVVLIGSVVDIQWQQWAVALLVHIVVVVKCPTKEEREEWTDSNTLMTLHTH